MSDSTKQYPYPRRRLIRRSLQALARLALHTIADFHIVGRENLPEKGPLLVVANHFSTLDTAALVAAVPWPVEFLGGFQMVDAAHPVKVIPRLWGFYAVRRGSVSRTAMHAAKAVMKQDGVLAIFPEGGSWAKVLRPARPGTAYLAAQTGARLLPIGLDGLIDLFPALRRGKQATVTARIGAPFGPFPAAPRGRAGREMLDALGETMMKEIAALLPPERRGVYAGDPALVAAAQEAAIYPYDYLDAPARETGRRVRQGQRDHHV
jgi:1-acyl-sn-glycerol-3-phosphate acyltransferase